MNQIRKSSLLLGFLLLCFFLKVHSQTIDPIKKYDEIIDINKIDSMQAKPSLGKDELALLLPKLESDLYKNWQFDGEPKIWKAGESMPDFVSLPQDLLSELGVEKVLKQGFKRENHYAYVLIYKFMDFTGAYSAYTVLHSGTITKLKVGKVASESDTLVNFWKGNYFVDVNTGNVYDLLAKEFVTFYSQDISKNIQGDELSPVVAIQLPSLYRVQGSEKYCLRLACARKFFSDIVDFDPANFSLDQSGGIITAEYQLSDGQKEKDKEKIKLVLARYMQKETAQSVFNLLKENFEKKKTENKEMDIDVDIDDSLVRVKNKKNDYIMVKQKGNLLAIAYGVTNKKSGEQVLKLVPWPIEITNPDLKN